MTPNISKSQNIFTIYGSSLLTGLDEIKELSRETIRRITRMRPYKNTRDFFYRVQPSIDEGISLIKSRSLDTLGNTWPELYFLLLDSKMSKQAIPNLMEKTPKLRDFNEHIKVLDQLRIIGFIPENHILEIFLPKRQSRLSHMPDRTKVIGTLITRRTIRTKNNKLMCFLTLDDETDVLEVVVFPNRYFPEKIGAIMEVSGTMQDNSLIADFYKSLPIAFNQPSDGSVI